MTIAYGIASSSTRKITSAETLRAFEDARALGESMPSAADHIRSLGVVVMGKVFQGHLREARSLAEEILALARADESPNTLVTAHMTVGLTSLYFGEIEAALRHLERAVALLEAPETRQDSMGYDPAPLVHLGLGYALCLSGRPESGRAHTNSALQIARTIGVPIYLGTALSMAASQALALRDPAKARELAAEAVAHSAEFATPADELSQTILSYIDVLETRDPKRIEPLRELVIQATGPTTRFYGILTEACLIVGLFDEADKALDAAFDTRGEVRYYDAELLRLRAVVLLCRPTASRNAATAEEAERILEQAIEVASRQGTKLLGLRATIDICRLWVTTDKRGQAHQRLTAALATLDEGFDEVDLREARALLDELEAG